MEKKLEFKLSKNDSENASTSRIRPVTLERRRSQLSIEYRTLSIRLEESRTKTLEENEKDPRIKKELEIDFHKLSLHELSLRFNTDTSSGLDSLTATQRLQRNGKNLISPPDSKLFKKIFYYFFGGFCPLLWFASLICFLAWKPLGNPPDKINMGLAILLLIVIFLQAIFNGYQDWTSSAVMKSINSMLPSTATVIRDGKTQSVPLSTLVVGDLIQLKIGAKVPADVRIINQFDLKFDKSVLTGENKPVNASVEMTDDIYLESRNIGLMGTLITNGEGLGIVVATGDRTVMGKIAKLSSTTSQERSILQKEITSFVIIVTCLAILTSALTLIVWAAWLRVYYPNFIDLSGALVNSIGVLVAYVPEGLPIAVTLTLTLVARKMAKQKVLVKNLTVVETLGSVNVIASDKTGTLTQNRMFVDIAHVGDESFNREKSLEAKNSKSLGFYQLVSVGRLCNSASFDPKTIDLPINERIILGDGTDSAIFRFVTEYAIDDLEIEKFNKIAEIPFNSKNKWMLRIMKPKDSNNVYKTDRNILVIKGAPDVLLGNCTRILDSDGTERPLDDKARKSLVDTQSEWSNSGKRVILLCRRIITNESEIPSDTSDLELLGQLTYNLTVIGLMGILDPPRPEIPDVIRTCRGAGIRIFMVTGDYSLTASSIAKQVGIFSDSEDSIHTINDLEQLSEKLEIVEHKEPTQIIPKKSKSLLLTGSDLVTLSEKQWDMVISYDEIVFARTTPEQKLRIVQEFQNRDSVVGVTGDGVNDAPALKAANIGIAMGGGSEVAIEAADMVLLDNNFSSIVVALESGRLVFDNLKKVILYLLPAGSWSELIPVLVNVFLGVPLPLSTFLMISICVLTDMLPSIALMYEKAEKDVLTRPPRNPKKSRLVDWKLLVQAYLFIGIMESFFSHCMYFRYMQQYGGFQPSDLLLAYNRWTDGYKGYTGDQLNEFMYTGQSVLFVSLVAMQAFGNLFATRTRHLSLFQHLPIKERSKNYYLFCAQIGSILLACLIIYTPAINDALNTRPIPVEYWFIPLGFAIIIVVVDEEKISEYLSNYVLERLRTKNAIMKKAPIFQEFNIL
ncbi:20749_t:CDS:2 [Cetraspora pellucida]|uniref:20749_t:CDS:1 n=1 Tax=Cetraspora pellucida TaxID=1433469 RepID=A0A9N8WMZ6_9GLOM|nr:20749_t:CDS:2 [Cetraspora pellucida]